MHYLFSYLRQSLITFHLHTNKFQWNSNQNTLIFVDEIFVCHLAAILYRPQCVNIKPSARSVTYSSAWSPRLIKHELIATAPVFDVGLLVVSNQAGENWISSSIFYLSSKSDAGVWQVNGNNNDPLRLSSVSGLCNKHGLKQWWFVVNLALENMIQWNWNKPKRFPLNEAFRSVAWKIATVSLKLRCAAKMLNNYHGTVVALLLHSQIGKT